ERPYWVRPKVAAGGSPAEDGRADPLSGFLDWCEKVGLELSPKVYVSKEGTVSDYGLLAREDLQIGEVLFTVPRAALLSQHTTSIWSVLEKASLESQSGWVPLLLSLLHEYTASNSHWRPYFSLWPDFKPRLHFASIGLFSPLLPNSFQEPLDEEDEDEKEPNPPMMVPMADILNHVANHNANLEYSLECLKMVTTQPIGKGQEIFNTYGQMANWQLVHMYGFAEPYPCNTDDTADIQMVTVRRAALQGASTEAERQLVAEQWDFLCQLEMVGEEGAFVIGWEEVLTEEELSMTLKVLCMAAEEFKEFKEHEGWEDDTEDEESFTLSNETIPRLKASWKKLLHDSALLTLESYSSDLKAEQDLLNDKVAYGKLSPREQQALQVRYGQKRILHQLLELTS
uniref:N-lysine methyltransferase SETD6 n=1 Tax=Chelonoidis abingdonii TaxID=106734 RepID=A0A8C0QQZ4_CHEAB